MPARAASTPVPSTASDRGTKDSGVPVPLQWMIRQTKKGLFVPLPVVDTDPNSGTTFGAMPVWVVIGSSGALRHIHAAALTYNQFFGIAGQYQYFYFPSPQTSLQVRLGVSRLFNREIVADYATTAFFDRPVAFNARLEHSKDGSGRFFGFGPASPQDGESNYTLDTVNYRVFASVPVREDSPWRVGALHRFEANDISGSFSSIPDTIVKYPEVAKDVVERHHNTTLRAVLIYDTRDSPITTTRGTDAEAFVGGASKSALSEYNYYRYGAELKHFRPIASPNESEPRFVTAARIRFEDIRGSVPFWLLPSLSGKYTHRGYGEGRFTDHSMAVFGAEQRCRLYERKISGVSASLWLDPFFAYGTVASNPEEFQAKYLRPVFGTALRLVAKSQLVASLDFGVGQEGLKAFIDINYSY